MPLTWNTTKIKDELAWYKVPSEQLKQEQKEKLSKEYRTPFFGKAREKRGNDIYQMRTELNLLILLSMNIGMNEITEKNYHRFFGRIDMFQRLSGNGFLTEEVIDHKGNKTIKKKLYTLDMIKEFIGLKTNASTLTAKEYLKFISNNFYI